MHAWHVVTGANHSRLDGFVVRDGRAMASDTLTRRNRDRTRQRQRARRALLADVGADVGGDVGGDVGRVGGETTGDAGSVGEVGDGGGVDSEGDVRSDDRDGEVGKSNHDDAMVYELSEEQDATGEHAAAWSIWRLLASGLRHGRAGRRGV